MKIKITRATICDGKDVEVNKEVETSEKNARLLILLGKAVLVEDKKAQKADKDSDKAGKDK